MTSYIRKQKEFEKDKITKDMGLFGIVGGVVLFGVGGLNYLNNTGIVGTIWFVVASIGFALIALGLIVPDILVRPYNVLLGITSVIGNTIFRVLLLFVYYILIVPFGMITKKKREQYGYLSWDNDENLTLINTSFDEWDESEAQNKRKSNGMLTVFINVIGMMIERKQIFMIPAIIVLVILGLLLFFASSTVLAPFIYTLF